MTPFVTKYLPDEDLEIFERIRNAVNALPEDLDLGEYESGKPMKLTCHILAETVAKVFGLQRVDGWFCRSDHSWVIIQNRHIIDVYPVAIVGGPILVCGSTVTAQLYEKQEIRPDLFKSESFKKAVEAFAKELQK